MKYVIALLYTVLLLCIGMYILERRYHKDEKDNIQKIVKKHKKYCVGAGVLICITVICYIMAARKADVVDMVVLLRYQTLLTGCYVLAVIDYKEHLIPNKIILSLLGIRLVFMAYEAFAEPDFLQYLVLYPFLGALVGGGFMLIGSFISRKGMGMGDVKLFFMIGLYVGSYGIMPTLIYSFLLCAVIGLLLVFTKHAGIHDTIPLAPFAYGGVLIQFALIMIGG